MSNDGLAQPDAHTVDITLAGPAGQLVGTAWKIADPQWVAVIAHGYGEHVDRYGWVAGRLNAAGASVFAVDHVGHGRSAGERVLISDFEPVVEDLHLVVGQARREHPDLPVVLIGHSMGGMIAARYAQLHREELIAMVLSGPVLARWGTVEDLLAAEEIPPTPIDPSTLSRDDAVGAAYAGDPLVWHGDFARPTLQGLHDMMERISAAGSIGDLPLLYLHGEADQLVPIEDSLRGLDQIRGAATAQKTYPGARHEIFHETHRDEVLDDVIDFVQAVRRGRLTPRSTVA